MKPAAPSDPKANLRVDFDRLWSSLMELGQIGGTEKGGVCRIALTDLDRQGRDLFVKWAKAAGFMATPLSSDRYWTKFGPQGA
jgi:beta-ureidopropionase / N-carbamoyl-L-amino-acid hydrolase